VNTSKTLLCALAVAVLWTIPTVPIRAATPAQEQAFLASYQKAFEGSDEKTLRSFLYTKDADPTVVEFYKAMQSSGMGGKVTRIELVALTPDQEKEAGQLQGTPTGKARLPLPPTRKLVLEVAHVIPEGSSKSTSECFVAEVDGKLVILVPTPVK
jgi:hypothetical protein